MSDITRQKTIDYLYYLKTHYPKNLIIPEYIDFAISSLETDEAYQLEYESTTKNDLGVDCISRERLKQIVYNITAEYDTETVHIDRLIDEIENMPSVAPQEPKTGHWICDGKGRSFADYHCSECGHKLALCGQDIKQRQDSGYSLFCDGCGAKMIEP